MTNASAVPLTVYAASQKSFEFHTPTDWSDAHALNNLFSAFGGALLAHGWELEETVLEDLGVKNGAHYWRVSRD